MARSRHVVFSTNKAALVGFARSLRGGSDAQIELFHYSEQERLDGNALRAHALTGADSQVTQVSVLLLATAASSYLWFDPEHCPRNVELCGILRTFPGVHVNFVICPTTRSARDAWEQNPPDLPNVFRDFGDLLPDSGRVDLWPNFDAEEPIHGERIRSLVCRAPAAPAVQPVACHQQGSSGSKWKSNFNPRGAPTVLLLAYCAYLHSQVRANQLELGSAFESHGKMISEVSSDAEGQARDIRHDLASRTAELHDQIQHVWASVEGHQKSISEIDSRIKSHATSISKLDSTSESHGQTISELGASADSQAKQFLDDLESQSARLQKRIESIRVAAASHDKKIGEFDLSIKSHADSIARLDSTSESHGKMISELGASAESQAKQLRNDFESRTAELEKRIDHILVTTESHDKKIGDIHPFITSHADSVARLNSTCESHVKMISELRTNAESQAQQMDHLHTRATECHTKIYEFESISEMHKDYIEKMWREIWWHRGKISELDGFADAQSRQISELQIDSRSLSEQIDQLFANTSHNQETLASLKRSLENNGLRHAVLSLLGPSVDPQLS